LDTIKITNVFKSFNEKEVLKGVNLDVNKGENFLLIGRSGAGKTVLLKNIIGLLRPDSGTIVIDNEDITRLNGKDLERVRLKLSLPLPGLLLKLGQIHLGRWECEEIGFPESL